MKPRSICSIALCMATLAWTSTARGKDLCLEFATSGQFVIFKDFSLKRGQAFALNGYTAVVNFPEVTQRPLHGEAMVTRDGRQLALGFTEYNAFIAHDFSGQPGGGGLDPGGTPYTMLFVFGGGQITTGTLGTAIRGTTGEDVQVIACDSQLGIK